MTTIRERGEGEAVWIPCEVTDGMFPDEKHIRIAVPGAEVEIEGFVPDQDIYENRVRAIVTEVRGDQAMVLFRGEILSRTNPVVVPASTEVEIADRVQEP